MKKTLYVMMIEKGKTYNKINKAMVVKHVDFIKNLDDNGKLVLCGPLSGLKGVAGMIIFKAQSKEEAEDICKSEPFVAESYATYNLSVMTVGDKDNNYLL